MSLSVLKLFYGFIVMLQWTGHLSRGIYYQLAVPSRDISVIKMKC